jgi:ribonuclease P protein component
MTSAGAVAILQRLKSREQFQAVMAGAPAAKTPHFVLHRGPLDAMRSDRPLFPVDAAWMGVVLPKRWARRAVTRNAIRRQIHELSRQHAEFLPKAAWVVRLRSEFSRKQFVSATSEPLKRAVRAELEQLLSRVLTGPPVQQRADHAV